MPRTKRIKRMLVIDAGEHPRGGKGIVFQCGQCGHNTGWIADTLSLTENKRGLPCPTCNSPTPPTVTPAEAGAQLQQENNT
jgi:DNA-directed RNA polymerase subunit RPC12/RpoP